MTRKTCCAPECRKPVASRGLCYKHYERKLNYGDYRGHFLVCQGCGDGFWSSDNRRTSCSDTCSKGLKYYYNKHNVSKREKEVEAYQRRYRESNREKLRQASRERYRKYPEKVKSANHLDRQRRYRAISTGYKVSIKSLCRCLERYNYECAYCGVDVRGSHQWDHVIPLSRGGCHSEGNLLPACSSCNNRKSARTVMEWRLGRTVRRA